MADLRKDAPFVAAVAAARQAIEALAQHGVDDAEMIQARANGWNNLQAHARHLPPLAVLFARHHPETIAQIRAATSLNTNMDQWAAESRHPVWDAVKTQLTALLATAGGDIISDELRDGSPLTAADIARTYLSVEFGGGQSHGGAGNTVLKRTLKLVAHTQHV